MAKITVVSGNVAYIHPSCRMVDLNDADVAAILGAVAGVAKLAAGAGAVGLGALALGESYRIDQQEHLQAH